MINIIDRISYHTWTIGFIESSIENIIASTDSKLEVHWVKHNYKDRFFADPFILSVDELKIEVLVEEFPYYYKKGVISKLIIDKNYNLVDKKVVLEQPFHQSFPFIVRLNNTVKVIPEASASGCLYSYDYDFNSDKLINQKLLVPEPLLDSTFLSYNNKWWIFCTKEGPHSNSDLYIYYSDSFEGPYTQISRNPILSDSCAARSAGYIEDVDGKLFRFTQVSKNAYGENVRLFNIQNLTTNEFQEEFDRDIFLKNSNHKLFHTFNGFGDLIVVDGNFNSFSPISRVINEFRNKFVYHNK